MEVNYLLGQPFTIFTDQQSLRHLIDQVIQTPEQQQWLGKLVGFDFRIMYRPGKLNKVADALLDMSRGLNTLFVRTFDWIDEIRVATQSRPEMFSIKNGIEHDPAIYSDYVLCEGLLFFKGRLVIPSDSPICIRLL